MAIRLPLTVGLRFLCTTPAHLQSGGQAIPGGYRKQKAAPRLPRRAESGQGYSRTAPYVKPRTMYFWRYQAVSVMGMVTSSPMAQTAPQSGWL